MRDDILGGIRNALEHGTTLEQAVRSFLNAGYPEPEVREVAKTFEGGTSTMIAQPPSTATKPIAQPPSQGSQKPQPIPPSQPKPQLPLSSRPQPQMPPARQQPMMQSSFEVHHERPRPSLLVIILSFVLLLSMVGFILSLIFRVEIAAFLTKLLSG